MAECAFSPGDCVITIGTGSFISVNVGSKPLSSDGSYPLAGVKCKNGQIYIIHSPVSSAGIAINWAKSIGRRISSQKLVLKTTGLKTTTILTFRFISKIRGIGEYPSLDDEQQWGLFHTGVRIFGSRSR